MPDRKPTFDPTGGEVERDREYKGGYREQTQQAEQDKPIFAFSALDWVHSNCRVRDVQSDEAHHQMMTRHFRC